MSTRVSGHVKIRASRPKASGKARGAGHHRYRSGKSCESFAETKKRSSGQETVFRGFFIGPVFFRRFDRKDAANEPDDDGNATGDSAYQSAFSHDQLDQIEHFAFWRREEVANNGTEYGEDHDEGRHGDEKPLHLVNIFVQLCDKSASVKFG